MVGHSDVACNHTESCYYNWQTSDENLLKQNFVKKLDFEPLKSCVRFASHGWSVGKASVALRPK